MIACKHERGYYFHESAPLYCPDYDNYILNGEILDPESDCYECEASMCGHQTCRGDQYHYDVDNYVPDDDIQVPTKLEVRRKKMKKILSKLQTNVDN